MGQIFDKVIKEIGEIPENIWTYLNLEKSSIVGNGRKNRKDGVI